MAKKTSTKKTAAKSAATPPVCPVIVVAIRAIAIDLSKISDVPELLVGARTKLFNSIERFAGRVEKSLAGAGKKAEKEAAKVVRAEAKTKREADRRTKKVAARDALRKKLADMDAELKS